MFSVDILVNVLLGNDRNLPRQIIIEKWNNNVVMITYQICFFFLVSSLVNLGRCACPNQIDSFNLIIQKQFKNQNIFPIQ